MQPDDPGCCSHLPNLPRCSLVNLAAALTILAFPGAARDLAMLFSPPSEKPRFSFHHANLCISSSDIEQTMIFFIVNNRVNQ